MSWAIVHGTKRIENRPRDLPKAMRGVPTVVAVHAGKKWDDEYADAIVKIMGLDALPREPWWIEPAIVGLMRLTGRVFTDFDGTEAHHLGRPCIIHPDGAPRLDPWFSGPYGYEISHACALATPIPCRGMLGFWPVPDDVAREVLGRVQFVEPTGNRWVQGAP